MVHISRADASDRLAELVARAARGEDVCISDPQHGTVRLTPAKQSQDSSEPRCPGRAPGLMKGKAQISDEQLLARPTDDELTWLRGETSR